MTEDSPELAAPTQVERPPGRWGRLQRWLLVVLGVLCVVVGVFLVFDPFASLAVLVVVVTIGLLVTGISDLAAARDAPSRGLAIVAGVCWIAAAVVVAVWPGITIRVLTVVVGIALIVSGVLRGVAAIRGTTDQRLTAGIAGAASIAFGILALAWPDVTVFVIAVVFGARMVLFGLSQIWNAVRRDQEQPEPAESRKRPSLVRRLGRTTGAVAALVVALLLLSVSSTLRQGSPHPDAFYSPPANASSQPGTLLRSEAFTAGVPTTAHAWRILYTTTRDENVPATASAIVLVANNVPSGPRPVIAWAHGTTGYAEGCAPSLLKDPFKSGATPALDQIISKGWVLVATDYVGLGTAGPHPYLIGQGEARSVLDGVRAAKQLNGVDLSDQTVVWGHSQGGNAALWAGMIAPAYAPDANVIGVAALAPASDLPSLVGNLNKVTGGSIFASFVVQAYSDIYRDVQFDDVIRPQARVQIHEMASRCLSEPEVFVSVVESLLFDKTIFKGDPTKGAFGTRLQQNIPTGPIQAPLFIGQGQADELVLPTSQAAYAQQRCAAGGQVDYRTYPNRDHVGVVADDSPLIPDLMQWTQDRLDGKQAQSTCSTS